MNPSQPGGPSPAASRRAPHVVVGVSDSATARWALAGAIGEARTRGMPLLVVHVSPIPQPVTAAISGAWSDMLTAAKARGAATLSAILDEVCGGAPPDLDLQAMSVIGDAGKVLADLAQPGDLLVLGRSTRGPIRRLLRPSARRYCMRHARTTLICIEPPTFDELLESLVGGGAASLGRRRRSDRRWRAWQARG